MPQDSSLIAGSLATIIQEISSTSIVEYWDKLIVFFSSRCFQILDRHNDYLRFNLASRINELIVSFFKKSSWSLKSLQSSSADSVHFNVSDNDIVKTVCSFSRETEVGPDRIHPHHLKELISKSAGIGGASLLRALKVFVNMVLAGKTPPDVHPFFFGAALVTFHSKCGDMRPMAIGCTLKRLAAKCAIMTVKQNMKSLLIPHQLGFGVKHGAEAIVHSARIFLEKLQPNEIMIKLVYKDAFNSIFHSGVIAVVEEYAPELLPFVNSLLSIPSYYFHDNKIVRPTKSLPERDPLAPLLFCLATHRITTDLKCDLKVFYLGIGILGGQILDVFTDLESVKKRAKDLGLELDYERCKIICHDPVTLKKTVQGVDSTKLNLVKKRESPTLLRCPLGSVKNVEFLIHKIIISLEKLKNDLVHHQSCDTFSLLRNIYSLYDMKYILSCTPCFLAQNLLQEFDEVQCSILSHIVNTPIQCSDPAWIQATLPVKYGGLGVRSAVTLAPCAFLASASACYDLIHQILPDRLHGCPYPSFNKGLALWQEGLISPPPPGNSFFNAKTSEILTSLLNSIDDASSKICILSATRKESQAWIHGLLSSSLAQEMDNEVVRIAIGLRLGVPLCVPHTCRQYGTQVDKFGRHGLSCPKKTERYAQVGSIVRDCLDLLGVSHCELSEMNEISSEGTKLTPWRCGQPLVWYVTVVDTFAPYHSSLIEDGPGAVANRIETVKTLEQLGLLSTHCYVPLVIETTGVFGTETAIFIKELAHRMGLISGDSMEHSSLLQKISIAIQCGNAAAISATSPP